jgi:hypothetical protein
MVEKFAEGDITSNTATYKNRPITVQPIRMQTDGLGAKSTPFRVNL